MAREEIVIDETRVLGVRGGSVSKDADGLRPRRVTGAKVLSKPTPHR